MNAFIPRSGRDISEKSNGVTLFSYILDLEAMVQSLSHALGSNDDRANLQRAFGLTAKEADLLLLLRDGRVRTKEQILSGLYFRQADDAPEIKIVDVFICKIRKKISGFGIEIETVWGGGYYVKDVAPLEKAARGETPEQTGKAAVAPAGRPPGAPSRPYGSTRDTVLGWLREQAVDGKVKTTSSAVAAGTGLPISGSTVLRNLEKGGHLKVMRAPRAGGRQPDRSWVVKLAA